MTTIDEKKMIAKYMGNDTNEYGDDVFVPKQLMFNSKAECMQGIFEFHECEFDNSWDWLMEVVKHIYKNFPIGKVYAIQGIVESLKTAEINEVYKEVVLYIKWFNKNNTSN